MKNVTTSSITRRDTLKYMASSLFVTPTILHELSNKQRDVPIPLTAGKKNLFAYRSFWPEFEAMKRFGANGVNTYCIFPANTHNSLGEPYSQYPPVWRGRDRYDYDSLNKQFDDVIALNSKAEFIAMIDLNSPIWLQKQFAHSASPGEGDPYASLSSTCANESWKKVTLNYFETIVNHLENRYGTRIKAYLLSCGSTSEWLDIGKGTAGRMKSELWRSWLDKKGKPAVDVPGADRLFQASFDGFVRDPQKEQDIVDYATFSGDLIVDTVLEFASSVRNRIPATTQVGVFFGYIMELANDGLVWMGHLEYERLFSSPLIDFFISPGTYRDRLMGGGSGFMIPNGTRVLNGKGFLHEIDHRTHTYNYNVSDFITYGPIAPWKNQDESSAGLKREFSLAIVNHASLWCFDMFGGVFSTEESMKVVKRSKEIWDQYASIPTSNAAEIALIVDPQSAKYVNDRNELTDEMYRGIRNKLNRVGAPFEIFSFNDLDKVKLDQYKLVIFPGSFYISENRLAFLKRHVFNNKRTVLFAYAPGICDGVNLDTARVAQITGTPFGQAGISKLNYGQWVSVYSPDYKTLAPSVLKEIARESGVNIYIESETPVYANDRLLAVHVADGGVRKIMFPRSVSTVKELFTNNEIKLKGRYLEYEFSSPDTALFEYR